MERKVDKQGKVSYRLLERRRIMDLIRELRLRCENISVSEVNRRTQRIARMGDEVLPVCLDMIRNTDDMVLVHVVSHVMKRLDPERVVAALQDFLFDPDIPDRTKIHLFDLLEHYGIDVSTAPLDAILQDPESLPREGIRSVLEGIEHGRLALLQFLEDLDEANPEVREGFLKGPFIPNILEYGGERALPLLAILAQVDDEEVAMRAISGLVELNTENSLRVLQGLRGRIYSREVKEFLERQLPSLDLAGLPARAGEVGPGRPRRKKPVWRAVITTIDGNGSRAVWIARPAGNSPERLETIHLLINTDVGIKDCFGAFDTSIREFKSMVRKLGKESRYLEGNYYDYAMALINDGLMQNRRTGNAAPLAFAALKEILDEERLKPRSYAPRFRGLNLERIKNDPGLAMRTDELFDLPDFEDWFEDGPRVYDFAEEYARFGNEEGGSKSRSRRIFELFRRFATEIIQPKTPILKRRLLLQADFLHRAGLEYEAKLALSARFNLDRLPLHEQPFITRMISESIVVALSNLSKG